MAGRREKERETGEREEEEESLIEVGGRGGGFVGSPKTAATRTDSETLKGE